MTAQCRGKSNESCETGINESRTVRTVFHPGGRLVVQAARASTQRLGVLGSATKSIVPVQDSRPSNLACPEND